MTGTAESHTIVQQPSSPSPQQHAGYAAFISYRHTPEDRRIAERLARTLEAYRTPRALVRAGKPRRIGRIFRDNDELAAGGDLNQELVDALSHSDYLIVICSPQTRESSWVMREIDCFAQAKGTDRILPVLVSGDPDRSFPSNLNRQDGHEPIAADLRGESPREVSRRFRTEKLRLLARLLGCRYNELRQREHERRIRRLAWTVAGLAVLAAVLVAMGVALYIQMGKAQRNYALAASAVQTALHAANRPQGDVFGRHFDLERMRSTLETLRRENPGDADATENLQLVHAALAAIHQELGKPDARDKAIETMLALKAQQALERLQPWTESLDKPKPSSDQVQFDWKEDPQQGTFRILLENSRAIPGTPYRLSMADDYVVYASKYLPLLDHGQAEEREEILRVVREALQNYDEAAKTSEPTSVHQTLIKLLKGVDRQLSAADNDHGERP